MKIIFVLLLPMVMAFAADQDILEKSYPRDNSFCLVGSKRIEFMVRGDHSHTEPKERMWGEHIFIKENEKKVSLLPVTSESGQYRFFKGNPSSCTKVLGTVIDGKFAVLFQKHNSPHKHRVVIQYLDIKTLKPLETVHTPLLANKAMVRNDGFSIRTHLPERQDIQMGKIKIGGKKYLFQDHRIPMWVTLNKSGIFVDAELTYQEFIYKTFFKSADDFRQIAGWDEASKTFTNTAFYVAINQEIKTTCILLVSAKKELTGEERWICQ